MDNDKYLPIGTILLLKGGEKKVMITGFCVIPNDKPHKMYDYCGYPYPEGCINSNEVCLFDHSQIDKIIYMGYINEEEKDFKDEIKISVKEITVDSDNNIINDNLSNNLSIFNDTDKQNNSFQINDSIF